MSEPMGRANEEMIRFIIEQVVDVVDSRREREREGEKDWKAELVARVAALEANERAAVDSRNMRDREIRDIKKTLNDVDTKLDGLISDKAGRDTAISLGKWIVGTGFFGVVGSVIVATLHYIGWLRPPA